MHSWLRLPNKLIMETLKDFSEGISLLTALSALLINGFFIFTQQVGKQKGFEKLLPISHFVIRSLGI